VLADEEATDVARRLDAALADQAEPIDVDPLVDWPALEQMIPGLRDVARTLRRAVLEGRPIRMRHHADGDGMCASVPVQYALTKFIDDAHQDDDAPRHLLKRLPSKAPYYEMEDATRDLNFALEDRARHGQKLPLLLMLDNGSTAEDTPAYKTLDHYDIPIVVVDHHHPDPGPSTRSSTSTSTPTSTARTTASRRGCSASNSPECSTRVSPTNSNTSPRSPGSPTARRPRR